MKNATVKKFDMREVALRYLSKGRSIIPVDVEKKPLIKWKEFTERLPTEEEIALWWDQYPEANIGIVTGKISGITVVDVEAGGDISAFPETKRVRTGGGGWHLYFKYFPDVKNGVRVLPLTDIRNDSGYVVAPPSLHTSGKRYEWINKVEKAEFPFHLFQDKENRQQTSTEQINGWDEILKGVDEGQRNDTATKLCGYFMRMTEPVVWESLVWSRLKKWNKKNRPPLDQNELRSVFDSIAKRELANRSLIDDDTKELKIVSAKELMELPIEESPHIVDKLIPEKAITIISADTGAGKSVFALIIARHVALGEKLFGVFDVKKQKVLYVDLEMEAGVIKDRNHSIVGEAEGIDLYYIMEQEWRIDNSKDYLALREIILREQYGLVILDTLSSIHEVKESVPDEMNRINKLLLRLIRETGVTFLIPHHNRKEQGRRSIHSARGATSIIDKASSYILIDSKRRIDEHGEIREMVISKLKSRGRGAQPFKLTVAWNPVEQKSTWSYGGDIVAVEKDEGAEEAILEIFLDDANEDTLDVEQIIEKVQEVDHTIGRTLIREQLKSLASSGRLNEKVVGHGKLMYSLAD